MEVAAQEPISLAEAIEDCQARFLNLPAGEVPTVPRVFFLIQQAHWFYEDELVDNDETGHLPHLSFTEFSRMMMEASPLLRDYVDAHEEFKAEFKAYSARIPKYGVIMLNAAATHVLLVAGYGNNAAYSFPKGKVNQGEAGIDCAAREAYEETGYNPRHLLHDSFALQLGTPASDNYIRLFVAVGVPDDGSVTFTPIAKKEIGAISWVELASCDHHHGTAVAADGETKRVRTYMVGQFINDLYKLLASGKAKGSGKKGKKARAAESGGLYAESTKAPDAGTMGGHQASGKAQARANPAAQYAQYGSSLSDPSAALGHMLGTPLESGPAGFELGRELGKRGGWSVAEMFQKNSQLTGVEFTYTGNPHEFGDEKHGPKLTGHLAASAWAEAGAAASAGRPRQERAAQVLHKQYTADELFGPPVGASAAGGGAPAPPSGLTSPSPGPGAKRDKGKAKEQSEKDGAQAKEQAGKGKDKDKDKTAQAASAKKGKGRDSRRDSSDRDGLAPASASAAAHGTQAQAQAQDGAFRFDRAALMEALGL